MDRDRVVGVIESTGPLRAVLQELTDGSPALADQLLLLAEGATVVAALAPGQEPALRARETAELLLTHGRPAGF